MIENKMEMLADHYINPNPQDVSRLFDKWREENLGSENGPKMFDMLDGYVKTLQFAQQLDWWVYTSKSS